MMREVPDEPHIGNVLEKPALKSGGKKSASQLALMFFVGVPAFLFWLGLLFAIIIISSLSSAVSSISGLFGDDTSFGECNVAHVQLHGVLVVSDPLSALLSGGVITSADSVVRAIQDADADEYISAILLDVNSPGGTPVAGDEILRAVEQAQKPVIAVMRDVGASAAYWAVAGADHIIASPVSDIGSIGVTMSYVESAGAIEEEGGRWVDISSGSFKDAGNPERVLKEEEQEYFQKQVQTVYSYMLERITTARSLITDEALEQLRDGRAVIGVDALQMGLIDELGSFDEAISYIENTQDGEYAVLCEPSTLSPWSFW